MLYLLADSVRHVGVRGLRRAIATLISMELGMLSVYTETKLEGDDGCKLVDLAGRGTRLGNVLGTQARPWRQALGLGRLLIYEQNLVGQVQSIICATDRRERTCINDVPVDGSPEETARDSADRGPLRGRGRH